MEPYCWAAAGVGFVLDEKGQNIAEFELRHTGNLILIIIEN
jgi:hypothetical protein